MIDGWAICRDLQLPRCERKWLSVYLRRREVRSLGVSVDRRRPLRSSQRTAPTIREFAALVRSGPGNEKERLSLLQSHEELIRSRIAAMQDNLNVIHDKVSVYERRVREGTAAGVWEPGPRAE